VAVQHFIDSAHHVVITTYSGDVTYADTVASLSALRRDPSFRPNYRQLSDFSQTSTLQLDSRSLKEIYCTHDPFSNEGKRAMVAPEGGVAFECARMYQSLVASAQFEIFASLLEAIAWLGLEITILQAASKRSFAARRYATQDDGVLLDLPSNVPRSFRGIRRRGAGSAG
jgi:hypothetical protein